MKQHTENRPYQSPEVTVIEAIVEQGFAGSAESGTLPGMDIEDIVDY